MREQQLGEQSCRNSTWSCVLDRVVSPLQHLVNLCNSGASGMEPGKELVHPDELVANCLSCSWNPMKFDIMHVDICKCPAKNVVLLEVFQALGLQDQAVSLC